MRNLSRRTTLGSAGLLTVGALAGCIEISIGDREHQARLTRITVENFTRDEQSVLVIIEDDGEQIYGEFTAVPPAKKDEPSVSQVDGLPTEPGDYDVYFNLARRPEDVEGEFWARAANSKATCREYDVRIRSDEDGLPQLGMYRSDGC